MSNDSELPALIRRLSAPDAPPFAVLHRPGRHPGRLEILLGRLSTPGTLAELPVEEGEVLAVVPFRQLAERGMEVVDDGAPLLALAVTERLLVEARDVLDLIPDGPGDFAETGYDVPDKEYEACVRAVLADEIGAGAGSNVVIHRSLTGTVGGAPSAAALGVFARLLRRERQAYWSFVVHTPALTFVGASPERHVSVAGGEVRMNPISGTMRYPVTGFASEADRLDATLGFLADAKERDELCMVVDEELKMMAAICAEGGQVLGPYLKEMSRLAHTEYVLAGRSRRDVREILSATMFAPTVTGSPIRNACRVIARHERRGRGYYGGVLALLGRDAEGRQTLDAPILIRTATIAPDGSGGGTVRIPAGATLVRGSRPAAELAETRAKAAGVLAAFTTPVTAEAPRPLGTIAHHPRVQAALTARNHRMSDFWLQPQTEAVPASGPSRPAVTILHAEDDFTEMLAHLLRRTGHPVRLVGWDATDVDQVCGRAGLLLVGPGPGDPTDLSDERIAALHRLVKSRLAEGAPMLGVCLGHQVIAQQLGLPVRRLPFPDQGTQRVVDLFGARYAVGFYNSHAALPANAPGIELAVATGRVTALRGPHLAGVQFHLESVLTVHGEALLAEALSWATTS